MRRYLLLADLVLVGVLLILTTSLITTLLELKPKESKESISPKIFEWSSVDIRPLSYYEIIGKVNPFSPSLGPHEEEEPEPTEIPPTTLNLKLSGTVVGSPSLACAIIEKNGIQKFYKVGDKIGGTGAELVEIQMNRVLIRRNGSLEELVLADEKRLEELLAGGGKAPSLVRATPMEEPISIGEEERWVLAEGDTIAAAQSVREIYENLIFNSNPQEDFGLEEALGTANQVLRKVKVSPHIVDGRPVGIRTSDIQAGSIIERAGVRNGDVIRAINGHRIESLGSFANYIELYQIIQDELMVNSVVTIEVERGGEIRTLTYEVGGLDLIDLR